MPYPTEGWRLPRGLGEGIQNRVDLSHLRREPGYLDLTPRAENPLVPRTGGIESAGGRWPVPGRSKPVGAPRYRPGLPAWAQPSDWVDTVENRARSLARNKAAHLRALRGLAKSAPMLALELLQTPAEAPNFHEMPGWRARRRNCVTGCGGSVRDLYAGIPTSPTLGNTCSTCISFLDAQATWSASWQTAAAGKNWVGWIPTKTVTTGECTHSWTRVPGTSLMPFRDPWPLQHTWPSPVPARSPFAPWQERESGEPHNWPRRGRLSRPSARPSTQVVIQPPNPPVVTHDPYYDERPDPDEMEIKLISGVHSRSWVAWIASGIGEIIEFVDAAHSTLPEHLQWRRSGGSIFDLAMVVRHADRVDWEETARQMLANQIDDYIYGQAGNVQAASNRRNRRVRGFSNEAYRAGDFPGSESPPSIGELVANEIFRQLNELER